MPAWAAIRDLPLRRFTVDEVGRLLERHALVGGEVLELVDGYLVEAPEPTARAAFVRHELAKRLDDTGLGAWVGQRRAVAVGQYDRPEADVLVANRPHADFADRHPTGADLRLVVEVADGNQAFKRTKAGAYAAAGVPEYWIVDVANRRIEVYREPHGRAFVDVRLLDDRDSVEVGAMVWKIAEVLG